MNRRRSYHRNGDTISILGVREDKWNIIVRSIQRQLEEEWRSARETLLRFGYSQLFSFDFVESGIRLFAFSAIQLTYRIAVSIVMGRLQTIKLPTLCSLPKWYVYTVFARKTPELD